MAAPLLLMLISGLELMFCRQEDNNAAVWLCWCRAECGQGSSEGEAEESSLDIILCFAMVPDNTITRTTIVSTLHQPTLQTPHNADISKILYPESGQITHQLNPTVFPTFCHTLSLKVQISRVDLSNVSIVDINNHFSCSCRLLLLLCGCCGGSVVAVVAAVLA